MRLKRPDTIFASAIGQAWPLLCALGVIWGAVWFYLGAEYRHTVQEAVERSANLAQTLDESMSRSATVLDNALRNAREIYIHDPEHFRIGPWIRDRPILMANVVQMSIADTTGTVVTASGDNGPPPVNIADREHFRVHAGSAEDNLFISKPVTGRTSGRLSIQFTRRIVNVDGSFAGVAVVSFDPIVLSEFHNGVRLHGGFTMLIGTDGIIRAAQPDQAAIGKAFPEPAVLRDVNAAGNGPLIIGTETVTDDQAIVSYRKIAGFPLFVAAGFPHAVVFAPYESKRWSTVLAAGVLSLLILFVGVVAIRHRRRLDRFHHALLLTMDNISQGILMIDQRRRMPVVNGRVAELLGLPAGLADPGADFDALVRWQEQHGECPPPAACNGPGAGTGNDAGTGHHDAIDPNLAFYECTRANGTVLEVRTNVLPDGRAVRTFTDVTERKRIERDLANGRDAAEAGIRARTEFLAVMSHEIRTPMNGIMGAAGLLAEMRLDPEQRDYVRIITESSEHLASLIQDILDFSLLDAGRLELEEVAFDPGALVLGTVAMLDGQARTKGLTLTASPCTELPARLVGDAARFRQILVNLIGNAIKFTNTGSVSVDAHMIASGGQTVTLGVVVRDTGIGIDPDSKKKLFSAFTQLDSSVSRRFGGTGLGLAICKHLITLMGGSIDVVSTPGEGSTFLFTIHLRALAEQPAAASDQAAPRPGRCLRVLLAEDNPTNRHVAVRMLTRMGHVVDAVEDGGLAIRAAAATDYDIILMDVMMPEVDGLTATRTIRAGLPPRCRTRIVGLTANALPADRAACEAAGMNGFVTKPVTLDRLRAVLEETAVPDEALTARRGSADAETLDAAFLRRLGNEISPDGVIDLVRIFIEDARPHMAAIRRGMAEGLIPLVRREAHALAGAAASVGLPRLSEAARALQHASEQSGPNEAGVEAVAAALRDSLTLAAAWIAANEILATSGA